jgi:RND family efflux transporter MFP subunit
MTLAPRARFERLPLCACAAVFAAAVLLTGCGGAKSESENAKPAEPVLLVTASRAKVQPMRSELRLLGRTVAMRHVIIRAPTAGRVVGMKLISGDAVRKNQVVARIINREIEAAEAGLAVARTIDRQDAASLAESVGRYNRTGGIPVVSPESGIVSQPPVTSGQMVADLDPLVDLIDPASLHVEAAVPVNQLSLVQPGMPATVTTPFRPDTKIPARVAAVMPTFDATSASSTVRLDFAGKERIAETGAPVEVRVETAVANDAIVIPVVALFQGEGTNRYYVFVVGPDGLAHRTSLEVGLRDANWAQVSAGLKAGDLVVTSGGYALSDKLKVRVDQAGAN